MRCSRLLFGVVSGNQCPNLPGRLPLLNFSIPNSRFQPSQNPNHYLFIGLVCGNRSTNLPGRMPRFNLVSSNFQLLSSQNSNHYLFNCLIEAPIFWGGCPALILYVHVFTFSQTKDTIIIILIIFYLFLLVAENVGMDDVAAWVALS